MNQISLSIRGIPVQSNKNQIKRITDKIKEKPDLEKDKDTIVVRTDLDEKVPTYEKAL